MAVTVAPLTTTVMNSVGRELAGVASGVNNAVSRAAGLLAIAVFALLMAHRFDTALEARLAALELPASVTAAVIDQRHRLAAITLPDDLDPAAADAIRHAVSQSFVAGFRAVMLACAALSALSALVSAALIGRAPPSGQG